jgi:hypothetical protein
MQNRIAILGVATALLAVGWSQSTLAQSNCGNIVFSGDISSRFPNARNACLDVVTREGKPYAHFKARVVSVRSGEVQAEFKQPNGDYGRTVTFRPESDARIRIAGTTYRYRDLSRGQELDVYLPSDRWEIAVQQDPAVEFAAAPVVTLIALNDPPQQVASLPRTGSPLPLLAVLGTLLVAFGAGVRGLRQKLERAA